MDYADGKAGLVMRPEFKDRSALSLIVPGVRTATTRKQKPEVSVGEMLDAFDNHGNTVRVRVTKAPYQLPAGRDAAHRARLAERWSQLEGWSPAMYDRYIGAWQFQYELASKPTPVTASAPASAPASSETSSSDVVIPARLTNWATTPARQKTLAAQVAEVAERKTGKERGIKLTQKTKFAAKDQAKMDRATQFIGQGSSTSSTATYYDNADRGGMPVNTGLYSPADVVFVSAEGNRPGRRFPPFSRIKDAMTAGATILTDVPGTAPGQRDSSYNVGEREVAQYLSKNGYSETEPGVWRPATVASRQVDTVAEQVALSQDEVRTRRVLSALEKGVPNFLKMMRDNPKNAPEVVRWLNEHRDDAVFKPYAERIKNILKHDAVQSLLGQSPAPKPASAPAPATAPASAPASAPQQNKSPVNVWAGTHENATLSNLAHRPFSLNLDRLGVTYDPDSRFVNFGAVKFNSVEQAYQSMKSGRFDDSIYDAYQAQIPDNGKYRKIRGKASPKTTDNFNIKLMEALMQASFFGETQSEKQGQAVARFDLYLTGDRPITHTQDRGVWAKEFPRILSEIRRDLIKEMNGIHGTQSVLRLAGQLREYAVMSKSELAEAIQGLPEKTRNVLIGHTFELTLPEGAGSRRLIAHLVGMSDVGLRELARSVNRLAEQTAASQQTQAVRESLGAEGEALERAGLLEVHDDPSTVPSGKGQRASKDNKTLQGKFDGKKLHLVAGNLDKRLIKGTLLHEAWHMMLGALHYSDNRQYRRLLDRLEKIERDFRATGKNEWFIKAMTAMPAKDKASRDVRLNELAAYAITQYESAPRSLPQEIKKWVDDFIAGIKAFLTEKTGYEFAAFGPADFAAMARRFLDRAAKGELNKEISLMRSQWGNAPALNQEGVDTRRGNAQTTKAEAHALAEEALAAETEAWKKQVVRYIAERDAGKTRFTEPFKLLSSTPAAMQVIGLPNLPVYTSEHTMKSEGMRLSRKELESLPDMLAHPVMVYVAEQQNGKPGFVFATPIVRNGERLLIALQPNQASREKGSVHFVATVVNKPEKIVLNAARYNEVLSLGEGYQSVPGLSEALQFGKRNNGRRAREVRDQASRTYSLTSIPTRIMYPSDTVKFIEDGRARYSKQTADEDTTSQAQLDAALEEIKRILGKSFPASIVDRIVGPNGELWSGEQSKDGIKVARGAIDPVGVGRHEALHQIFSWLRENGGTHVIGVIENLATNPIIRRQLMRLLNDHPNAIKQLADPEEAAAYLFQFWQAGQVTIGPKTETLFDKVAQFLIKVGRAIRQRILGDEAMSEMEFTEREQQLAEQFLEALSGGVLANENQRSEVIEALEKNAKAVQNRERNLEALGLRSSKFFRRAIATASSTFERSGNSYIRDIGKQLFRLEGDEYRVNFIEEKDRQLDRRLAIIRNMVTVKDKTGAPIYTKEDLEKVQELLSNRVKLRDIHAPHIKSLVKESRKYMRDMLSYQRDAQVMRFDMEKKKWVPMGEVSEDYWPRVWDIDALLANPEAFLDKMTHAIEVNYQLHGDLQNASKDFNPREEAQAIYNMLVNGKGTGDPEETNERLGISSFAASVNRRSLAWLDDVAEGEFKDFFSKDYVNTITTYTAQAVRRAEQTRAFGNGSERLAAQFYNGVLEEMGKIAGVDNFIEAMFKHLNEKVDRKDYDAVQSLQRLEEDFERDDASAKVAIRKGMEYLDFLKAKGTSKLSGNEAHNAALGKLEDAAKAIQAIEGTLGGDISPTLRKINNGVTTYQNFRLLPFALFSSIFDPVGILVRGGELQDAFNALARGFREIGKGWKGEHSTDALAQMAEEMGVVSGVTMMDALGQSHSSQFMTGTARRWNNALFKWNGLEAWNRAMRIQATGTAMNFIKRHINQPGEHSQRYLEELFPKGTDFNALFDKDGNLDPANEHVIRAVQKWVNGAILRPNAAHRPILASDPHYTMFYHLKQFSYSFHKVILRRVAIEMKHGNYSPLVSLVSVGLPLMIASDVGKELLIPGDEPYWMKNGLGGVVEHGVSRANLLGLPQYWLGDTLGDPLKIFSNPTDELAKRAGKLTNVLGPAPDELADLLLVPIFESKRLVNELAGALPFGVVARRMVD
ncbi:hypothetical protein FACS1894116_03680 [Betaproteobacteria bacterium]|nr:hypothetical protein FACS1894116_03680 [Betaproteobacteria bacterium]GHU25081.1 hypothetical protein FACS189488_11180 [Betaproteobacteria bacterium]